MIKVSRHVLRFCWMGVQGLVLSATFVRGEIALKIEHDPADTAAAGFNFKNRPPPRAGLGLPKFVIVDGVADPNSGGLSVLTNGRLPENEDEPSANFFFQAGTSGGRLLLDLGSSTGIREVNSFSWHPGSRAPQVYTLYGSEGRQPGFGPQLRRPTDPLTAGWKLIAKVDTRAGAAQLGGQYDVKVSDSAGPFGPFRFLLFDIWPTETNDAFGNTFFSEIQVVAPTSAAEADLACIETLNISNNAYRITIDTCETPDLREWTKTALTPVVCAWYPKLVALLPGDQFIAPRDVMIHFSDKMSGVAATSGSRISCAAKWFRSNLQGEAVGSVVHELVHVVQQYGLARRANPNAPRPPGWLVEGIADYIRWFLYEPQSHGADVVWLRKRPKLQLRYDAGYRVTANFLDWVVKKYDPQLIGNLNAALRSGVYREEFWAERTAHSLPELGEEWSRVLGAELGR